MPLIQYNGTYLV